jgi:hypothetical protein
MATPDQMYGRQNDFNDSNTPTTTAGPRPAAPVPAAQQSPAGAAAPRTAAPRPVAQGAAPESPYNSPFTAPSPGVQRYAPGREPGSSVNNQSGPFERSANGWNVHDGYGSQRASAMSDSLKREQANMGTGPYDPQRAAGREAWANSLPANSKLVSSGGFGNGVGSAYPTGAGSARSQASTGNFTQQSLAAPVDTKQVTMTPSGPNNIGSSQLESTPYKPTDADSGSFAKGEVVHDVSDRYGPHDPDSKIFYGFNPNEVRPGYSGVTFSGGKGYTPERATTKRVNEEFAKNGQQIGTAHIPGNVDVSQIDTETLANLTAEGRAGAPAREHARLIDRVKEIANKPFDGGWKTSAGGHLSYQAGNQGLQDSYYNSVLANLYGEYPGAAPAQAAPAQAAPAQAAPVSPTSATGPQYSPLDTPPPNPFGLPEQPVYPSNPMAQMPQTLAERILGSPAAAQSAVAAPAPAAPAAAPPQVLNTDPSKYEGLVSTVLGGPSRAPNPLSQWYVGPTFGVPPAIDHAMMTHGAAPPAPTNADEYVAPGIVQRQEALAKLQKEQLSQNGGATTPPQAQPIGPTNADLWGQGLNLNVEPSVIANYAQYFQQNQGR